HALGLAPDPRDRVLEVTDGLARPENGLADLGKAPVDLQQFDPTFGIKARHGVVSSRTQCDGRAHRAAKASNYSPWGQTKKGGLRRDEGYGADGRLRSQMPRCDAARGGCEAGRDTHRTGGAGTAQ